VPSTEAVARVRDQALEVARGWSADGAPGTWRLTAALFEAVTSSDLLATAHPSGTRMTWLDPATAISG
jgi:hypothetical protein